MPKPDPDEIARSHAPGDTFFDETARTILKGTLDHIEKTKEKPEKKRTGQKKKPKP